MRNPALLQRRRHQLITFAVLTTNEYVPSAGQQLSQRSNTMAFQLYFIVLTLRIVPPSPLSFDISYMLHSYSLAVVLNNATKNFTHIHTRPHVSICESNAEKIYAPTLISHNHSANHDPPQCCGSDSEGLQRKRSVPCRCEC